MLITLSIVLAEWMSLLSSGRRLEEVGMWLTAVVDRLVVRNSSVTDIKGAAMMFVKAWQEFSREVINRVRGERISCQKELLELERIANELVLHEIEKVLLDDTTKDLLEIISLGTTPVLENVSYIGMIGISIKLHLYK